MGTTVSVRPIPTTATPDLGCRPVAEIAGDPGAEKQPNQETGRHGAEINRFSWRKNLLDMRNSYYVDHTAECENAALCSKAHRDRPVSPNQLHAVPNGQCHFPDTFYDRGSRAR
jgi:hypothetical protein